MPRQKKLIENTLDNNDTPKNHVISVPTLGDVSALAFKPEEIKPGIKISPPPLEIKPQRIYLVFEDGEFLEEIEENSDKLDFYLNQNKNQLEFYVSELNSIVDDPNLLIFFHEGKQDRKYMSFESFYNQNGLAPKNLSIQSWMQFYKLKYPFMAEEEIAIKVKGNLKYSFEIKAQDEE